MMEKKIEYKGYIIKQTYDINPIDPLEDSKYILLSFRDSRLEWESITNYYNNIKLNIIEYFNSNEDFTFDHLTDLDYDELDEDKETVDIIFKELQKLYYMDGVSIHEHGDIHVSRGIQNDWDSWVEGIVYTSWANDNKEKLEYEIDKFLEFYTSYINGENYSINIYKEDDEDEEIIDCFSYTGYEYEEEMIETAKSMIDELISNNKQ